ncbi:inositol monophosphatase [Cereibacter sphaeroides]|nr:inositol monophosphatase [Cereibacter sphaeroides]
MIDVPRLLQAALNISDAAAEIARQGFETVPDMIIKADESPVTATDRATERAIRDALQRDFPNDGIYGEEFGTEGLDRDRVWVIDPIDGTKSFITGVPLFGLLMAMVEAGETQLGVIRLPSLNQVYCGGKGMGAQKDGLPIHVSKCDSLSSAKLFINEAEKIHAAAPAVFERLCAAGKLRRMGYDCHPHALLAEGRIDAVVDYDLKPYDYLPVVGVVEAAGGVITDWQGQPLTFSSDGRVVAAATPSLHAELLALLNG